ncbi:MAG: selenium-dependent molybdenum cofactor biosynthesis protein YqeB [Chloroflexota bacterium]|nr:selenium-dependent molybdenum cofactor biosynthesis protein YqeB [Chloroflexota bacterium]
MTPYVLIWGGGDLASGVALRLHRVGVRVVVVERSQPLAVRRSVSFAQAVYDGAISIEDVRGRLIRSADEMAACWETGEVPVIVDPDLSFIENYRALVLVDARMRKKAFSLDLSLADLVIGLGPGFTVGENCHAAVETNRGHFLGRVYWEGSPEADTGIPGKVQAYAAERVLHAPAAGVVETLVEIGDTVSKGNPILQVAGQVAAAPFDGVVRGLIHDGLAVKEGMKVGDVDPRPETFRCWYVSEKSLAIGGGVLEAVLTREAIRDRIW